MHAIKDAGRRPYPDRGTRVPGRKKGSRNSQVRRLHRLAADVSPACKRQSFPKDSRWRPRRRAPRRIGPPSLETLPFPCRGSARRLAERCRNGHFQGARSRFRKRTCHSYRCQSSTLFRESPTCLRSLPESGRRLPRGARPSRSTARGLHSPRRRSARRHCMGGPESVRMFPQGSST